MCKQVLATKEKMEGYFGQNKLMRVSDFYLLGLSWQHHPFKILSKRVNLPCKVLCIINNIRFFKKATL